MEVCLEEMVTIPAPEVPRLKQALQHSWTTKGMQKAEREPFLGCGGMVGSGARPGTREKRSRHWPY